MDKITIWYKLNIKTNKWQFNHIERNWKEEHIPIPESKYQKSWLKNEWIKNFGFLDENSKVIE